LKSQTIPSMVAEPLALGIDFGTSGVRGAIVDSQKRVIWQERQTYSAPAPDIPQSWKTALFNLLSHIPSELTYRLNRICIDGTSSTVLLCDELGQPLTQPLMYNDHRGSTVLEQIRAFAPAQSPVMSATSSLAKLMWWHQTLPISCWQKATYILSQADWVSAQLHGQWGVSDYHNSLKLGYDAGVLGFQEWMQHQPWSHLLPRVVAPGTSVGAVTKGLGQKFGLHPNCQVVAGTTDSIAAFLASGAAHIGDAVTSLGSTLVLKLLSQYRVDASQYGIYSHRLGEDLWLVGGASNTGGAVLKRFFDNATLERLSQQIDPEIPPSLNYYPLNSPGERFPINDPTLHPRLTPTPEDPLDFLREMLWGIAHIEHQGYELLETLGASPLKRVYTSGGGARNAAWRSMRAKLLQKPIKTAAHTEAAVGSAYLALGQLEQG
jgi:sugar (pentulose or hexulose) kinase